VLIFGGEVIPPSMWRVDIFIYIEFTVTHPQSAFQPQLSL